MTFSAEEVRAVATAAQDGDVRHPAMVAEMLMQLVAMLEQREAVTAPDAQRAEDYAQYVGYAFLRLIEVARKVPGYEGDGEFNEAIRMVDHYVGKATLRYRDEQEKQA